MSYIKIYRKLKKTRITNTYKIIKLLYSITAIKINNKKIPTPRDFFIKLIKKQLYSSVYFACSDAGSANIYSLNSAVVVNFYRLKINFLSVHMLLIRKRSFSCFKLCLSAYCALFCHFYIPFKD